MNIRTLAMITILVVLAAAPASAAVVPCVNGQAGQYACKGVDLLSFMPHSTWSGQGGNDIWGWTDPVTGHEYALVGTQTGTAFVDITVPESPVYVGVLPCFNCPWPPLAEGRHEDGPPGDKDTPRCEPGDDAGLSHGSCTGSSLWRDMEVYADHVYIGSEQSGHGVVVFDLRQLRDVTPPQMPEVFTQTSRFGGVGQSHTITVDPVGGTVFINGSRTATACAPGPQNTGGPVMLDASVNPGAPAFAGCNLVDGYTHDSQCVTYAGPHTAYVGHQICLNSNEDTLTIVDTTNKQSPVLLSRRSYPGVGYTHQGWLTADSRYFLLDDELDEQNFQHPTKTYIFDVTNLTAPTLLGTHFGPTAAIDHNQYIAGRYAYQSNYRAGLRVLHAGRAGLGRLREVAFFDIYPADNNHSFNGTWANYPFFPSGNVVVNTMEANVGLFVLRPRRANVRLEVAEVMPGTFRITVTNEGPADVESAEVMLTGGRIKDLVSSQGTCRLRLAACDVGALAAGAFATVDVVLSSVGGSQSVHASVEATGALDETAADDAVDFAPSSPWR